MEIYETIRRYLKATGMPPCVFGRLTVNDPRLVDDLRNGRQPRARTVARIKAFIASHPHSYVARPRGRQQGFHLGARSSPTRGDAVSR